MGSKHSKGAKKGAQPYPQAQAPPQQPYGQQPPQQPAHRPNENPYGDRQHKHDKHDRHSYDGPRYPNGREATGYYPEGYSPVNYNQAGHGTWGEREQHHTIPVNYDRTGPRPPPRPNTVPGEIIELTPSTFNACLLDPTKFVAVAFYAPWCNTPFMSQLLDAVAGGVERYSDIVITRVDAEKYKDIFAHFDCTTLPGLIFFPKVCTCQLNITPLSAASPTEKRRQALGWGRRASYLEINRWPD